MVECFGSVNQETGSVGESKGRLFLAFLFLSSVPKFRLPYGVRISLGWGGMASVGRRKKWKKESKSEVESFAALGTARGRLEHGDQASRGWIGPLKAPPGGRDGEKATEHQRHH